MEATWVMGPKIKAVSRKILRKGLAPLKKTKNKTKIPIIGKSW